MSVLGGRRAEGVIYSLYVFTIYHTEPY